MKVAIAGSSGLIGRALAKALSARGDHVVTLSRSPASLEGADAVVNLAGAPLAGKRWNAAYKQEILDSRVSVTHAIVELKPPVLLNSSAVGYYGARGDEELDEKAAPGNDFLAGVCKAWE